MNHLPHIGDVLRSHARVLPDKTGARDLDRAMTFAQWNARACRLANALIGLGLGKGDRVAVLAYNCVEWLEIYAATAKAGLIAVPINFRLREADIRYLLEDCDARALIVQDELLASVASLDRESAAFAGHLVHFGGGVTPAGYVSYEALIAAAREAEPAAAVTPQDIWVLIYTSGTTGKPKGAMRSHGSHALLNFATLLDMGFG